MFIIRLTSQNYERVLDRAVGVLKNGGIIIYPTETAYGLGADLENLMAIRKIYRFKGRSFNKPLPVIAANLTQIKKYVKFSQKALILAKRHWPGALTIILKLKSVKGQSSAGLDRQMPKLVGQSLELISCGGKLGVRVSGLKLARDLALGLGRPITATSANLSSQPECYSVGAVLKQFKNNKIKPDLVIDAGRLNKVKPSTVAEVRGREVRVLRQGVIKISI